MLDVYKNNKIDNILISLFNTRLLILTGALFLPLLVMNSGMISANIDSLILYLIMSTGFLTGIFIFKKSISNPVISYLILQMVLFFIFFDKKILSHFGLNLKLYGVVFIIALSVAIYHLIKNFKYLWNSFPLFKYFFVYFILMGLYLLFHYHSDFRLSNDLLSLRYAQSLKVGGLGNSQTSREFGDLAQYILHIEWLIPIVSIIVPLMLFKGLKTIEAINNRLIIIIKYFSAITLIHLSLAGIAYLFGLNNSFLSIGAVNDVDSGYFFPIFLYILLGFKYYLTNLSLNRDKDFISIILNSAIAYILILIISAGIITGGSSAMVLGMITGLLIILFLNSFLGLDFPFFFSCIKGNTIALNKKINIAHRLTDLQNQKLKTVLFIGIVAITILYLVQRMAKAFNGDVLTLNMRFDHWRDSYQLWISSLNLFKVIFGYGLDTLREAIYFASNSSAIERGIVSPHNMFILMIYEQGLIAFIYLTGIISTLLTSIKYIKDKTLNINVKIFSIVNIGVVAAIFAMWCFIDMALISRIIFLSTLGFLESVKFAYANVNKE